MCSLRFAERSEEGIWTPSNLVIAIESGPVSEIEGEGWINRKLGRNIRVPSLVRRIYVDRFQIMEGGTWTRTSVPYFASATLSVNYLHVRNGDEEGRKRENSTITLTVSTEKDELVRRAIAT